ncbi:ABC transporter ATP-binding protein [Erysipelotrichaceae bacterium I46]|uniref:ABC transporter ATP-binding protein n=1 Tax=Clostridium innocuum TaxID=1522 RepID=UPI00080C7893|nr:ABC transporter ATP-binding protein [[Clostridium] innocuum]ANU67829.1 ABC transporter ATP-binding protein [Erysipelotrichaceae bacterium I46]ASU19741.1 ABC transporter ATP-binding protein [[Clostridium] innocuum]QQR28282.1 ABC transporter ATP-binding protein [[Clostridium] innocuum]
MALIHCEDLTKRFHQGKQAITAVNHVSMDICPHKITAICGPSGCGKSTLLHMLGLLMKPDEGKIIINGQEVKEGNDLPAIRNESFGYIFQEYALMEQDTVMENIALPFVYSKKKILETKQQTILSSLCEALGIQQLLKKKAHDLSGGERQRTAIARALVNNPSILLADEPTGALDAENSERVFQILLDLRKQEKAIVFVTHNMELAKRCNIVYTMRDGCIAGIHTN